jgi:ATP-dependent helicase/nuclease subunit B
VKTSSVQIRFLLGPAGTGKTWRCLAEIREALLRNPEGRPLVLLAPKQATFQLERQLLGNDSLSGFTRLHILSFDRIADFIFERQRLRLPELLSEDGRVMVLRALLEQKRDQLELFRASARLPGFARQLGGLLRELRQHRITPGRLEAVAKAVGGENRLQAKLRDLATMARLYVAWLQNHGLQDADQLPELAADALGIARRSPGSLQIEGLWLDGFAQMNPQERRLLTELVRCSESATLAFCLDRVPAERLPWHSEWSTVAETFLRCRDELAGLPDADVHIENLVRDPARSRFTATPLLQHLEQCWSAPAGAELPCAENPAPALRVVACSRPETEVEFAAREIRRSVREGKARYRDIAVLARTLDLHRDAIRRIFTRYEIPFFLDRREGVAHHPLAELTRYALRVVAYGWEPEDWFGALKTGLVPGDEAKMDWLENEALARGWRGEACWSQPLRLPGAEETHPLEPLRELVVPAFLEMAQALRSDGPRVKGATLAAALQRLWQRLKVDRQLEQWSDVQGANELLSNPKMHETVWSQMLQWLASLELAFADEALFLNEWLPIVEAGLSNLSVGVVPPALDQVLVGAIDRSRNPDLRRVFILGMNEGVFPAPPVMPVILNRTDRETLAGHDTSLGLNFLDQIGLERYYGYIACTRARERVTVTFAQRDNDGRELNPSLFIAHLRRLFPLLEVEEHGADIALAAAEHWSEAVVPLLRNPVHDSLRAVAEGTPRIAMVLSRWNSLANDKPDAALSSALTERIYGPELQTSVSALEAFAACPFRFFVSRGLRAEEREEFEIDPREKGSFQHEVLQTFHLRLQQMGRRWREVSPSEARLLVRQIGEELLPTFREGMFMAAKARQFAGRMLLGNLERLVETLTVWMAHYQFDPAAVELSFGLKGSRVPGWRIDLGPNRALVLRGRIDRVDVFRDPQTNESHAVVIDYKSSAKEVDAVLLDHGLELQLLAYLGALRQFESLESELNVSRVIPAGAFYVALRGGGGSASNREEERSERDRARIQGCQHRGRFNGTHLLRFDSRGGTKGEQFRFSITKQGEFAKRGNEAMSEEAFLALVQKVEEFLRQHGREIYEGKVSLAPFRYQGRTACDFCVYRPICRFDPWTQPFRVLRKQNGPAAEAASES